MVDMLKFQARVMDWTRRCFGDLLAYDRKQRADRFMEEALELYQSAGGTIQDVSELAQYVYGRPAGNLEQEVGGVILTLSSVCSASYIDMGEAGLKEITRAEHKIESIREKQASKVNPGSALPGGADAQ